MTAKNSSSRVVILSLKNKVYNNYKLLCKDITIKNRILKQTGRMDIYVSTDFVFLFWGDHGLNRRSKIKKKTKSAVLILL